MDRHDGKELAERPMVEKRLKDREIANVLIAEGGLELFHFVGHVAKPAMHADNLSGKLPIEVVNLGFGFEIEQAKIERLLCFFLDLLDVMQALEAIAAF